MAKVNTRQNIKSLDSFDKEYTARNQELK